MLSNIKAYFKLSKWESIAMLVLCGFMLLLVGINYSLPFIFNKKNNASAADSIALQQLAAQIQADTNTSNWQQYKTYTPSDGSNIHGFAFNPNELDDAGWKKLGFSDKAVNTILNYKNKGGKFYCKADVQKMYSISEAEYTKLEPFIQLPATKQFAKNRYSNNYTTKEKITVEINSADTATLNQLRGIGSTLAWRIAEYRKQIGGFYSTAQLKEVYGISDSLITFLQPQLKVDASRIQKININTVLYQTLNAHPYFKNGLALAILKFRKSNGGKIENLEQIKNTPSIDVTKLEKAKWYIGF